MDWYYINRSRSFNAHFYVAKYEDLAKFKFYPLIHYLLFGWHEGRNPNPFFDTIFYLKQNEDVAKANNCPLGHYVRHGMKEGRRGSPSDDVSKTVRELFFSVKRDSSKSNISAVSVAIVICVYKGLNSTRKCIESVLSSTYQNKTRIIIINDATPEKELDEYLNDLGEKQKVEVYTNTVNVGFVKSANKGMNLAEKSDVVLLNSDTEVAGDWLDRMICQAYSAKNIGTVTPFSNNATICSYPNLKGAKNLPAGETLASLDRVFAEVNAGRNMDIPTAIGFCMYIKRACLSDVGSFDETAFGHGYGEENDFCLRAKTRGWRHILAADTFVFHEGGVSFGNASEKKDKAIRIIRKRYPSYESEVSAFIRSDPTCPLRVAVTAKRYLMSGRPVPLFIHHGLGGGVARHMNDLIKSMSPASLFLMLYSNGDRVVLETGNSDDGVHIILNPVSDFDFLVKLLKSFGTSRAHIHHLINFNFDLRDLLYELSVPFDFTIHDYYTICPQVFMVTKEGRYCGEPDRQGCNACIALRPWKNVSDIVLWRKSHEWLFVGAEKVISPSHDAAARISKYHPSVKVEVIPHEVQGWLSPKKSVMKPQECLRICILGALGIHKGLMLVKNVSEKALKYKSAIDFYLIGYVDSVVFGRSKRNFHITGRYEDSDLSDLIDDNDFNLIWFPVAGPETYSFTLSKALSSRLPIIAPNLGAFRERLEGRNLTWLVDWNISPEDLLIRFMKIREGFLNDQQRIK